MYQGQPVENTRKYFFNLVHPTIQGAYTCRGGQSSLIGNFILIFLFLFPFPLIGIGAIGKYPSAIVLFSALLFTKDLLRGGLFLDLNQSKHDNFGYNLLYMWIIILFLFTVLAAYIFLELGLAIFSVYGVEADKAFWGNQTKTAAFLVAIHIVDYLARTDKQNIAQSPQTK